MDDLNRYLLDYENPPHTMLLTIGFTILNAVLALLETRIVKINSFDLAPILTIAAANAGENVIVAAILISAPYAALSKAKLQYLWLTLPLTVLIGFLAGALPAILLIILFHILLAGVAFFLGQLSSRYFIFAGVNLGSNIAAARIYAIF